MALGQHDGIALDVPHRAPGEEQVGQLVEGWAPLGDDLQLVAVLLQVVEGLHEQSAADPLEVEVADPQLGAVGIGLGHLDDLEALLVVRRISSASAV